MLTLAGVEDPAQAQTYVDASASAGGNGTSWTDAYTDLQDALGSATTGDEIWIATGTYTPGTARADRFQIDGDGLKLYGGFDPAGGDDTFADRDPAVNPTILSGDIGVAGDASDNSYHVLFLNGFFASITPDTVIDGVTITGGNADGAGLESRGGGLLCEGRGNSGGACSPTLTNLTITNNNASEIGGGVYLYGAVGGESSPAITGSTFENNTAGQLGGAIYSDGDGGASSPMITGSTFDSNTANSGGALYNSGGSGGVSNPTITDAIFTGNTALENAGSDGNGAAIFNATFDAAAESSPTITNSLFVGNTAERDAGAIFSDARDGGTSSPTLTNLVIANNTADSNGGGVYNLAGNGGTSSPTITNVTFFGNTAAFDGGAMVNDILASSTGSAQPTITNTIFFDNQATNVGDAIFNRGSGAVPAIRHSLFTDGLSSDVNGTPSVDENNLAGDPLFVDASTPAGPDGILGTFDDGLRVTAVSPVIARGSLVPFEAGGSAEGLTTDLVGSPRIFGARPDLGAYEFGGIASTSDDISDASSLLGYLEPGGFGGLVLLRENPASSGGLAFSRTGETPASPDLPENVAPLTWTVTSGLNQAPTYDLIVDVSSLSGIGAFEELMLYKSDDGGTTWDAVEMLGELVLDADRALVAVQDLKGFSQFAVASTDASNPLPVELAGLQAQSTSEESIMVQWQTLSETGNAGFEVQRRAVSGVSTWQSIAMVQGAGTTDQPQSYRVEDADLPYAADRLSYRLRQIDADGTESFSESVTVARQVMQARLLPTYPSPARGQTTIRYAVPERQDVRIELYDILGRRVQTVVNAQAEGRTEAQLDVSGLTSGTYFLRMQTESHTEAQRVTVVR